MSRCVVKVRTERDSVDIDVLNTSGFHFNSGNCSKKKSETFSAFQI